MSQHACRNLTERSAMMMISRRGSAESTGLKTGTLSAPNLASRPRQSRKNEGKPAEKRIWPYQMPDDLVDHAQAECDHNRFTKKVYSRVQVEMIPNKEKKDFTRWNQNTVGEKNRKDFD